MLNPSFLCIVVVLLTTGVAVFAAADSDDSPVPDELDLTPVDRVVESFMESHDISAGTFAMSVGGQVVDKRAYGFRDAEGAVPTKPDTPMRIASVSKPIAAAVVLSLIEDGTLSRETKVFELLNPLDPPEGAEPDARLSQITVGHLLEHRGGWDREASGDPMFRDAAVQERLGIEHPPDVHEIIRFMLGEPLDFDPGERSAYSNFGYALLGRVAEAVTGEDFADVVRERIADPLELNSLALGRTYIDDRPGDEVHYPIADGSLHVERMDAHGGLIANAADLCVFLAHYWISGEPRDPVGGNDEGYAYAFFGGMPGTTALVRQRADGIDYAILLNAFPFEHYQQLLPDLDEAIDTAMGKD